MQKTTKSLEVIRVQSKQFLLDVATMVHILNKLGLCSITKLQRIRDSKIRQVVPIIFPQPNGEAK